MWRSVGLVGVVLSFGACAPVFQDARLLEPGQAEVTGSFSGAGVTDSGESEYVVNAGALQAQVGVTDRVNVGVGYARFQPRHGDSGINSLFFGPKISVVRDRLAVALPASLSFGEDIEVSQTWQIHPTALFTVPMNNRVDFNPSARLLIPFCDDCGLGDTLVGLGAGFGMRAGVMAIVRPEVGVLFNPGESGVVWTFGVGLSIRSR